MTDIVLQKVRGEVESLLGQGTTELDAQGLMSLIQTGIAGENSARDQSKGARSTLVLNGLLAAELTMTTEVFGLPRPVISADY
jgi:hypothetical protein